MENGDEDDYADATDTFTTLGWQALEVVKKLNSKKLAEVDREGDDGACGDHDRGHRADDEKQGIVSVEQHQRATTLLDREARRRSAGPAAGGVRPSHCRVRN